MDMSPQWVIFDNDAAVDDMIAFLYLHTAPNMAIKGITVAGTGEAHGEAGAKNMAALCHAVGLNEVPIAYGTGEPINKNFLPFPDSLRESVDTIWKGKPVKDNPRAIITHDAVELMRKIIVECPDKVTFLATGPLTNIALFIKQYPGLMHKIEKIVIMGGAIAVEGNIKVLHPDAKNNLAECNIAADPESAQLVFSSNIPVVLVPLDATNQVPMTEKFYLSLQSSQNSEHHLIYLLLKDIWDQFGRDIFIHDFYLWDPLAAMICAHSDIAEYEQMSLCVDSDTGQTKRIDNKESGNVQVATKIVEPQTILTRLVEHIAENTLLNTNKAYTPVRDYKENKPDVLERDRGCDSALEKQSVKHSTI